MKGRRDHSLFSDLVTEVLKTKELEAAVEKGKKDAEAKLNENVNKTQTWNSSNDNNEHNSMKVAAAKAKAEADASRRWFGWGAYWNYYLIHFYCNSFGLQPYSQFCQALLRHWWHHICISEFRQRYFIKQYWVIGGFYSWNFMNKNELMLWSGRSSLMQPRNGIRLCLVSILLLSAIV